MCAFGIWFEMLLLDNFHDGFDFGKRTFVMVWTYFLWWCALMKYDISCEFWNSHKIPNSREITSWRWALTKYHNSHEITSWRWALTKYHKKPSWKYWCKPGGNVIFMRVAVTVNSHENNPWRWTFMKICISWVYYRESWCVTVYPHTLFSWE
jgi:hypothetical protein